MSGAAWDALRSFFLPSALLAVGLVALMRALAPRIGFVDHPAERKSHVAPIPLGGGIGIALAMLIVLGYGWGSELIAAQWSYLFGGGIVLLLLGATDDRFGLPWPLRLAVHFLCAMAASYAIEMRMEPTSSFTLRAIIAAAITLLINSYNMLDNIDALASGTALCAALPAAYLGLNRETDASTEAIVLLSLAGAIAGFLVFNVPPASIFLGDAGSYWIGYWTAGGTIAVCRDATPHATWLGAMLVVLFHLLPLYDTATVVAVRLCERRSPFQADRCHASHRLLSRDYSKRAAAFVLIAVAASLGTVTNVVYHAAAWAVPYWFGAVLLGAAIVGVIDVRSFLSSRRIAA